MRRPSLVLTPLLIGMALASCSANKADEMDKAQVARGKVLYADKCAACHGANLEGQPNWRVRRPDGKLPAPPHDRTGHTWEHSDQMLFDVTKYGFAAKAGAAYQTDMRPFKDEMTDEQIWDVLAYIKSSWPESLRLKRDPRK